MASMTQDPVGWGCDGSLWSTLNAMDDEMGRLASRAYATASEMESRQVGGDMVSPAALDMATIPALAVAPGMQQPLDACFERDGQQACNGLQPDYAAQMMPDMGRMLPGQMMPDMVQMMQNVECPKETASLAPPIQLAPDGCGLAQPRLGSVVLPAAYRFNGEAATQTRMLSAGETRRRLCGSLPNSMCSRDVALGATAVAIPQDALQRGYPQGAYLAAPAELGQSQQVPYTFTRPMIDSRRRLCGSLPDANPNWG